MLEPLILQILRMFPRGTTDGQLLFRLGSGGLRNDPSAVLNALTQLAERGEIWRTGNRWHVVDQAIVSPIAGPSSLRNGANVADTDNSLAAVPATIGVRPHLPEIGDDERPGVAEVSWVSALSYYASTQRQDPRGQVERFADQHSVNWQLFHVRGRWWDHGRLLVQAVHLPHTFRETLARAGHRGTAAVGWPMTVMTQSTGATLLPGLLLPTIWELGDSTLTVTVDVVPPVINPAWMRAVRRRIAGRQDDLTEAILGSDEEPDLGVVAPRLAHTLASLGGALLKPADLAQEMALAGDGLRNAAALILPDEAAFTRRVAEDLDRIAKWEPARRRGTAIAALIAPDTVASGTTAGDTKTATPLVAPQPLSDAQTEAAEAALKGPVTAIQGPPGTGKSQTIVALIASSLAAGQSVLFVARNHRALDEVEARIASLLPGVPVMTRGRDAEGERDTNFCDALRELAAGGAVDADAGLAARRAREDVLAAASRAAESRRVARDRTRLHLALSDLADRITAIRDALPPGVRLRKLSWVTRVRLWIERWRKDRTVDLAANATVGEIETRMDLLRADLARLPVDDPEPPTIDAATLRRIASAAVQPDPGTAQHLRGRLAEIEFQRGGARIDSLTAEDAALILRHRPIWAISSLSVPGRVPLIPALFDLAIFDEASQADIASSLPVLARARRAVIVGDPQQLSFIPGLGREQEHALMDAAGLTKYGRARWAQSINSLFDFAAHRLRADHVHLLTDQFRSAPQIVDYTSSAFYGGRLVARRDDDAFAPPKTYRPGLHWEDVKGTPAREDGGNVNAAEAKWIAARIAALAAEDEFDGTVGVISPFNAQVGRIDREVDATLMAATRERLKLHVGTVDRWQGAEADVVFFSLVVGPGAPMSAINFLSKERRRFNVAISRAKAVAVVVGDFDWARTSRIAHIADLADRTTRSAQEPQRGFDSLWERRVDMALRARGLDAKPQYAVGQRSLDFALFEGAIKLDLEVDGVRFHSGAGGGRKTSDRLRDREMIAKGWKVRRFWVWELDRDMEGCLDIVERDLGRR